MGVGDELKDQLSFLGGFKLTLQHMTRPRVTTKYPDVKKPKQPRQHGRHVLNRYEDGMEKCIGCELCAGVCPADCIYVRGLDNPPDHPVSPGERYGYVYEINYLRCITATCAWRPARPRPSPSRSSSSSPSPTARTPSTPRKSWW